MRVSVLMPAFNAERFISEAIESVLTQVYKNFELIILNDGSTDCTLSIARYYARKDKRIKVLSHHNIGMGETLNKALKLARNEWIVCMNADDVMLPNRIERQVDFIKKDLNIAVASSFGYYIDETGRVIGKYKSKLTSRTNIKKMMKRNELIGFNHPAVIMRKSAIVEVGGYRPAFWPCEDIDLWNRILERGYTVLVQPEYLLKYRIHGSSASVARSREMTLKRHWVKECMIRRRRAEHEPTWEEFLGILRDTPWWRRLNQERKDLAKILYKAATLHYSRRDYLLLFVNLSSSMLLQPTYAFRQIISKYGRP